MRGLESFIQKSRGWYFWRQYLEKRAATSRKSHHKKVITLDGSKFGTMLTEYLELHLVLKPISFEGEGSVLMSDGCQFVIITQESEYFDQTNLSES